jgi:hypothetical protein
MGTIVTIFSTIFLLCPIRFLRMKTSIGWRHIVFPYFSTTHHDQ